MSLSTGQSSATTDALQLGLYSTYMRGPLQVTGALGLGGSNYNLDRVIPIAGSAPSVARGDTDGNGFSASLRGAIPADEAMISEGVTAPISYDAPFSDRGTNQTNSAGLKIRLSGATDLPP